MFPERDPNAAVRKELIASGIDLTRVWTGVAGVIWARQPGRGERVLSRLLRSPGLARALLVTPSLLLSWILASLAVLVVGAIATHETGTPWIGLLAPAVAGIGIAYAYGPGIDPAYELSQTMPIPAPLVLLARCLAVFGLNALLGIGLSLVVTGLHGLTFGWLVPMTTISAVALVVALLSRSAPAGMAAALAIWAGIIVARSAGTATLSAAAKPGGLLPFYFAATAGLLVLAAVVASTRVTQELT